MRQNKKEIGENESFGFVGGAKTLLQNFTIWFPIGPRTGFRIGPQTGFRYVHKLVSVRSTNRFLLGPQTGFR